MPSLTERWEGNWTAVRAAGWTYDRERSCWGHNDGRWAFCATDALARHIAAGTPVPCRDEPMGVRYAAEMAADDRRRAQASRVADAMARVAQAGRERHTVYSRDRERPAGKLHPINNPGWEA